MKLCTFSTREAATGGVILKGSLSLTNLLLFAIGRDSLEKEEKIDSELFNIPIGLFTFIYFLLEVEFFSN